MIQSNIKLYFEWPNFLSLYLLGNIEWFPLWIRDSVMILLNDERCKISSIKCSMREKIMEYFNILKEEKKTHHDCAFGRILKKKNK